MMPNIPDVLYQRTSSASRTVSTAPSRSLDLSELPFDNAMGLGSSGLRHHSATTLRPPQVTPDWNPCFRDESGKIGGTFWNSKSVVFDTFVEVKPSLFGMSENG